MKVERTIQTRWRLLSGCALLLVAAPQLAERMAEDKALQKAMAEMMERMSDIET